MDLRLAKKSDIEDIIHIIAKAFSNEDAKLAKKEISEMFSKSFNKPTYVVAIEKNEIIGFAGFIQSWFDSNIYEIFWVTISPDFQKKGIGIKIVGDIVRRIKLFKDHLKADAIILSTFSPEFFMKCGFEKISTLSDNKRFLMIMKLE